MRSSIRFAYLLAPIGGLLSLAVVAEADAANRNARKAVAEIIEQQHALLTKFPSLSLIDDVVRADCSAKAKEELPDGHFCGCASAVTMSLWMSGIDPKMMDRLNDYVNNPSEEAAETFKQYQGPELYGPICKEAK